jgi:signal transduction histidine kinase
VDTAKNTFDVFFDGKTDLTIGMSGIKYELAKNNYPLLYDTNTYNKKTDLFMAVLKEYPEARSILQKGLDTITNEQFLSLRAKWQLDLNNNQSKNKEVSTLTKEEFVKVFINLINNTKDVVLHKDNAGGVSQEVLNKLFEPYFTTKFKSQGVGLSLFITKRIVTEKLNGQIKAEKNDKGLSYIIDINLD